jgi:glycosyltransferase involved in cell wall biosynthesis
MKACVLVTTCCIKEALALVPASLGRHSRCSDEVIVADDDSRADTLALLTRLAVDFPVPLRHRWQEEHGFRVARSRNRAIGASAGYCVLTINSDTVAAHA